MLGLLIVDDEPFIADSLAELFNNVSELSFEVYAAYSASEAFAIMEQNEIDIILSDISMPNIDGLQFQKMVGDMYPRAKIIFLTGYSSFDYARAALRGNCVDYFLKTEDDSVIIEAVKKAAHAVEAEAEYSRDTEELKRLLSLYQPLLQKECLLGILFSNIRTLQSINERFQDLNIPFDGSNQVLLLLGRIEYARYTMEKMYHSLTEFESIVTKHIGTKMDVMSVSYESNRLVWLIQPKDRCSYIECIDFVCNAQEIIENDCAKSFSAPVSLYMHKSPCSFSELQQTFEMLGLLAVMGDLSGDLSRKEPRHVAASLKSVIKKISLLENHLNLGNKDDALALLSQILDAIGSARSAFYTFSLEGYYYLSGFIISYINRFVYMRGILDENTVLNITKVEKFSSWDAVRKLFERLISRILDAIEARGDNASIVDKINQYIMNNLHGDTSLTAIANSLHYNSAYISRIYKNTTGETISEYISDLRINRAKEMLACRRYRVIDIAKALGFESLSYFDRFFKKSTGITPQEYCESITFDND